MGGSAFTDPNNPSGSLLTPRMPPPVYTYVRGHLLAVIRKFYAQAQLPIEAPAKLDYGDIDILAAGPLNPLATSEDLAEAMGTKQHKRTRGSQTTHFAIPWPKQVELLKSFVPVAAADDSETTSGLASPLFIQLDLHICPTAERFEWELFHQAHGDFWNIIGGTIRYFGLTANNLGLFLRIAEIETLSKEQSRIKLTSSPVEALKYLGLDEKEYWSPFDSLDGMFKYLATCRFHNPIRYAGKEDLKSNDRLRMKKRPNYSKWLEEWIPNHRDDEPGSAAKSTRAEIAEEAKRVFGVGEEYEQKREAGIRRMGIDKLWSDVRRDLPVEGLRVGVVMRGIKREVVGEADEKELSPQQSAYRDGHYDEIAAWVRSQWESIEQRQTRYEREKSTMHLLAKIERDKIRDGEKENGGPINIERSTTLADDSKRSPDTAPDLSDGTPS